MSENVKENRYNELADYLDALSDYDKKFVLWYLMDFLKDDILKEIESMHTEGEKKCDNRTRVMAYFTACDHVKALKELKQILCEDIF